MSTIAYSFIEQTPVPNKTPVLNGGLYTGQPFQSGATWGNYPVTPDAVTYVQKNLMSANPPPEALRHIPSTPRPGNNSDTIPTQACFPQANNMFI